MCYNKLTKKERVIKMKYNKSEIMKKAWSLRKMSLKWVKPICFGECLRRAWADAKDAARVFTGLVRNVKVGGTLMHPILVNIDMDTLRITGNTFPVRQLMREFGLSWDKDAKAWTGSRETLNSICVKYA